MANYTFATMMSSKILFLGLGHFENYVDRDNFRLNQFSLYGLNFIDLGPQAIYGYFPVPCTKTGVLYYPRSWGDENQFYRLDELADEGSRLEAI
jgi:hypothetical protein